MYRLVAFTVHEWAPGRVVHAGGDQRGTGMQARPVRQGRVGGALVERTRRGHTETDRDTQTYRERDRREDGTKTDRRTDGRTAAVGRELVGSVMKLTTEPRQRVSTTVESWTWRGNELYSSIPNRTVSPEKR